MNKNGRPKLPYKTTVMRIPNPLIPKINKMVDKLKKSQRKS
jgi:hypothetical protein